MHTKEEMGNADTLLDENNKRKTAKTIDKTNIKKTNRIIRSCTRCKKRKVKCNFEIPCDRCISRNQAHSCSREPIIYDGFLVNNNDEKELKFSQENEVLKKKIKELQETIFKIKSELKKKQSSITNNESDDNTNSNINNNNNNTPNINIRGNKNSKPDNLFLNENNHGNTADNNNTTNMTPHNHLQQKWNTYSITMSLLDKCLANGLIDSSHAKSNEMNYNTEDWLAINDPTKYSQYNGEDSRSQCWQYQLDQISKLPKSTCDTLVKYGLKYTILFPIIDVDSYLIEYENYWKNDKINEKQLSPFYSKSATNYMFLSLMYALMCVGIYQCDKKGQDMLNFTNDDWDIYPKAFFGASLECLYRARYMTHPHITSIKVIDILRNLCGLLGGNILANNITGIAFFLSFKLKIYENSNPLFQNLYWHNLVYDWYEEQDRIPLSNLHSCKNFTYPSKWIDGNQKLLNWKNYYLLFSIKIAQIKKAYYFDNSLITLDFLRKADVELRCLQVEVFNDIETFNPSDYLNISQETIDYIHFHVHNFVLHEILEVNLKMSLFISLDEWSKCCYNICYNNAEQIIRNYISPSIPLEYKSYTLICQNVVYAAVFLLVDNLLNRRKAKSQKEAINLVRKTLPVFKSYRSIAKPALRGIYVIEKLTSVLKANDKQKNISKKVSKDKILKSNNSNENNIQVSNNHSNNLAPNTNIISNNDDNDAKLKEYYDQSNMSNYSDTTDDSDDDNDMPLYYSTLLQQNNSTHIGSANGQLFANNNLINLPQALQMQNSPNQSFYNSQSPNVLPQPRPTQSAPIVLDTTFSEVLNTPTLQPQIHHTIMDILEDNGWIQFMNTIDDLDISLDVK